ncbi:MAG: hypothetical protein ACM3MI_00435 [Clostridiales bacterium]
MLPGLALTDITALSPSKASMELAVAHAAGRPEGLLSCIHCAWHTDADETKAINKRKRVDRRAITGSPHYIQNIISRDKTGSVKLKKQWLFM